MGEQCILLTSMRRVVRLALSEEVLGGNQHDFSSAGGLLVEEFDQ